MTARKINGQWHVDVSLTLPDGTPTRIRRKSPINRKRACEEYERELVAELLSSSSKKSERIERRIEDFAVEFLSRHADVHFKYSTKVTYRSAFEVHIVPYFAGHSVSEIGALEIAWFQAHLAEGGTRSAKTVRNIVAILTSALRVARDWGYIDEVPHVTRVKVPKPKFRFLSVEECEALEAATTGYWRPMIFLARMSGMRVGELRALQWEQVSFSKKLIRVDRAVWRKRVALPKHDKTRLVSLSEATVACLAAHRETRLGGHELVFPKADGTMRGQQRCGNALREIGTRAGIGPIGWHVLRHTFATTLVAAGVNIRAVQDLLGHANLSTTMRYAHLMPDAQSQALAALDSFVGASPRQYLGISPDNDPEKDLPM